PHQSDGMVPPRRGGDQPPDRGRLRGRRAVPRRQTGMRADLLGPGYRTATGRPAAGACARLAAPLGASRTTRPQRARICFNTPSPATPVTGAEGLRQATWPPGRTRTAPSPSTPYAATNPPTSFRPAAPIR